MSLPVPSNGIIPACGDWYMPSDFNWSASNPGPIVNGKMVGLYIPASVGNTGVRINFAGRKVRAIGLPGNVPSFGVLSHAPNNTVLFDGREGGAEGWWCGVQSDTPWTRIQELDLSNNKYMGVCMTAHTARILYCKIDNTGGNDAEAYAIPINIVSPLNPDPIQQARFPWAAHVIGNTMLETYRQATAPGNLVGEGCPIVCNSEAGPVLCEFNYAENSVDAPGTIAAFGGAASQHTFLRNRFIGFNKGIQGVNVIARYNELRRRTTAAGSIALSVVSGLGEENTILNYATPINPGYPTGSGNTIANTN